MAEPSRTLQAVAWNDLFPWLAIFRIFRLATSMPILLLATLALLIAPLGWRCAELLLTSEAFVEMPAEILTANRAWPGQQQAWLELQSDAGVISAADRSLTAPLQAVFVHTVQPFAMLFSRALSFSQFNYFLLGSLWTLAIWSLFGGAITRIAAVRIGRNEREGMVEAVRFALRRFFAFFASPLFPLAGVLVVVIFSAPVGFLMRADIGVLLASLVWILVLVGGVVSTVLLIGLALGWPLMWGALAAEEMGDVFEASQRCYSYTYGRPLHYLFYALVALVFGSAGWWLVYYFADLVVSLSTWAVSWGSGNARLLEIAQAQTGVAGIGNTIIQVFQGLVLTVASAYRYAFFWCAVAVVYLLLRRDVDHTEMDEVYVQEEPQRYGLPSLTRDAAGVPGVEPPDVPRDTGHAEAEK